MRASAGFAEDSFRLDLSGGSSNYAQRSMSEPGRLETLFLSAHARSKISWPQASLPLNGYSKYIWEVDPKMQSIFAFEDQAGFVGKWEQPGRNPDIGGVIEREGRLGEDVSV
jgi:hypothetical protein